MKPLARFVTCAFVPLLGALHAAPSSLLPPGWDPKRAGDAALATLIKATAPQAKGAHDADLVLVGERAYVAEHDNDLKPGHGAGNGYPRKPGQVSERDVSLCHHGLRAGA